mmetsp:Transcript_9629/g.36127  ORF Transcript_9629/g.36127 Transcript_9629/m.36127 type:complete len:516 (-) Transcript_9629:95-1642(-)
MELVLVQALDGVANLPRPDQRLLLRNELHRDEAVSDRHGDLPVVRQRVHVQLSRRELNDDLDSNNAAGLGSVGDADQHFVRAGAGHHRALDHLLWSGLLRHLNRDIDNAGATAILLFHVIFLDVRREDPHGLGRGQDKLALALLAALVRRPHELRGRQVHVSERPGLEGRGNVELPGVSLAQHVLVVEEGGSVVRHLNLSVQAVALQDDAGEGVLPPAQVLQVVEAHVEDARLGVDGVALALLEFVLWPALVEGLVQVGHAARPLDLVLHDDLQAAGLGVDQQARAAAKVDEPVRMVLLAGRVEQAVALQREEARLPRVAPTAAALRPALYVRLRSVAPHEGGIALLLRVDDDLEAAAPLGEDGVVALVLDGHAGHALQQPMGLARAAHPPGRGGDGGRLAHVVVHHVVVVQGVSAQLPVQVAHLRLARGVVHVRAVEHRGEELAVPLHLGRRDFSGAHLEASPTARMAKLASAGFRCEKVRGCHGRAWTPQAPPITYRSERSTTAETARDPWGT